MRAARLAGLMRIWLALLCCAMWTAPVPAGVLGEPDVRKLQTEIAAMYAALEKGDPGPVIAATHESIYSLVGGKDEFARMMRGTSAQMLEMQVKFLSSSIGQPTRTYPAGDEEVCFVPRISVMEVQGARARSTGFVIAIRRVGGSSWKYLDGTGLRKDPQMLKRLLPKLTAQVALPPITVEPL